MSFAKLLRRLRVDAGLTQEELAAAASLSPRSVSDLERGIHQTARKDTARLLADALKLSGAARFSFEACARGQRDTSGLPETPGTLARSVAATTPKLPHDIKDFTGRDIDLTRLFNAITDDGGAVGIYAIDGMAGVGKSTFAVHAAHLLEQRFPDGQIFLSLHAHAVGQQPVDPAEALASLLLTTGVAAHEIPAGLTERTNLWRAHLAGKQMLILLDDASGHEQVRPLLPSTAGSLVLITSRRHLAALDGARSICLDVLSPGEAATLLVRFADRPDLDMENPEVGEISRLCGYLPLALGMLGRWLHHHPAWTAAGLAYDLAATRDRLELMHAENLSVEAAFDLSYQDLSDDQQRLFRRLALHPGTSIDPYAAAALGDISLPTARHILNELFDQHLVTEPARGRFRMHNLIRQYARARVESDDSMDLENTISRVLDYYLYCLIVSSRLITSRTTNEEPPIQQPPKAVPPFSGMKEALEWLGDERSNLLACAEFAVTYGRPAHAIWIAAELGGFLRTRGYWDDAVTLRRVAAVVGHIAGNTASGAMTKLGIDQRLTGDYSAAAASLTEALQLYRNRPDHQGEADALVGLGVVQRLAVDYPTATSTLTRALNLYVESDNTSGQAEALNELGVIQRLTGEYIAAKASHAQALELARSAGDRLNRANSIRYLGSVQQATEDYADAESNCQKALELYRDIGDRLGEAHALNYLGTLQCAIGMHGASASTLAQALRLYQTLGHRLGQAEVFNNLGDLRMAETPGQARASYEQALAIAQELGALLEEAHAFEGIGNDSIENGNMEDAAIFLRRSIEIYRRIGCVHTGRVGKTLDLHRL